MRYTPLSDGAQVRLGDVVLEFDSFVRLRAKAPAGFRPEDARRAARMARVYLDEAAQRRGARSSWDRRGGR